MTIDLPSPTHAHTHAMISSLNRMHTSKTSQSGRTLCSCLSANEFHKQAQTPNFKSPLVCLLGGCTATYFRIKQIGWKRSRKRTNVFHCEESERLKMPNWALAFLFFFFKDLSSRERGCSIQTAGKPVMYNG